jgi:MoaA/NifB/PqqE/SkfB family radical SAM enzyme
MFQSAVNFLRRKVSDSEKKVTNAVSAKPLSQQKQHRLRRSLSAKQSADFYYFIDIVGTCNLRCPSCAVGNYTELPPKGLMSLETYRAILEKIAREHPQERIFIDLYNWGEPGLHKQLGQIIRCTNEFGFGVGISTNLNEFPDLKEVVKANPTYIRISLSGYYNETYKQTHKRGDINLVKSNMHKLRYYLDHLNSDSIVQVGFHVYRTNFQVDFWKMKELCEELDFIFAPTIATIMPVEKAVNAVDGNVSTADEAIISKLVISPQDRFQFVAQKGLSKQDCQFRRVRTAINFDGSVPLCCATFEKAQIIADNFLTVSREEIQARKYAHSFCKICMARSLDFVFTGVDSGCIDEYAVSVLGPKYQEFLDEWNVSLEPVVNWNEVELKIQEAYDLAYQYEINADFLHAKKLYLALLAEFPRHGEARFRLGHIFEKENNKEESLRFYRSALKLLPSDNRYADAVKKFETLC